MVDCAKSVGYTRVSTEDQAYEQTLQQHVGRLKAAGASRVYCDIGSRTDDNRAGLQEILSLAERGEIEQVYVTRLDRITSSPGLFEKLTQLFQLKGVLLVALDERVDLHSVDGEFAAGLQVYFSQREVRTIRLRIKKAYEHRRSKRKANTAVPWGYKVDNGQYKLDHSEFLCTLCDRRTYTKADLAQDIINLFWTTGSLSQAVKALHIKYGIQKFAKGATAKQSYLVIDDDDFEYKRPRNYRAGLFCWSRDGIRKWLSNPVLRGHTPYLIFEIENGKRKQIAPKDKWHIEYNTHPTERLLSQEQYQQIENIITTNHKLRGYGASKPHHPLSGLLFCGECGRGMKCQGVKRSRGERRLYYQCKNYQEAACSNKTMILDKVVEAAIAEALTQKAASIAAYALEPEDVPEPPELQQLRAQLAGLEQLGNNPALEEARRQVRSQIENFLHTQKAKDVEKEVIAQGFLKAFSDLECWNSNCNTVQKRQIYQRIISQIIVEKGKIKSIEFFI